MALELNIHGFNPAKSEERAHEPDLHLLRCNMNRRTGSGSPTGRRQQGRRREEEGLTERHQ
jgi:hypothetical protein